MRTQQKTDDFAPLAILLRDAIGMPIDGGVVNALKRDGIEVRRAKVGAFIIYLVPRAAFARWLAERLAEATP